MIHEFKKYDFSYGTPESVGISSSAIDEYAQRLKDGGYGVQGFIMYRHGKIVSQMIAQPYQFDDQRHVYSISKSWSGTAIGIARDDGLLSLDDKVIICLQQASHSEAQQFRRIQLRHTSHR